MKRQVQLEKVLVTTLFCCMLGNTACVNRIDSDIQEGDIPITFSTKAGKTSTKVINTIFEKGDNVGLFAILNPANTANKPYISNLRLECGDNSILIPEKTVFYPEGDLPLDFVSYYPYQSQIQQSNSLIIPISVETDQSDPIKYSQSNFLIAKKTKVESSTKAVELEYQHKLTKIKIVLTPGKDENIQDMLKANPRIIANGIKTKANYNLLDETFSDLEHVEDIVAFGKWEEKEDVNGSTIVGKEIIIIPQELNADEQSFTIDWNGRLYCCPFPKMDKEEGCECEINISAMQANSDILKGIVGKINEWKTGTNGKTDNKKPYAIVHLSALSFSQSYVYRIYQNAIPIAEICKEYLKSDQLDSRAIVVYPVLDNEKTDLSQGTVLQLLDNDKAINGGKIHWDTNKNNFSYEEGNSTAITQFSLNNKKEILLSPTDDIINVNVVSYTLRDIRNGQLEEYPIIKVGTQYWMKTDLHTTIYQDGKALSKQTVLGKGAGYFNPDNFKKVFFYNGEAILAGKLNPTGWKIPSEKDWNQLKDYINDNASLLKAGDWQVLTAGEVCASNNITQFSIYPVGMWLKDAHYGVNKMAAFWSWDEVNKTIPQETIFFTGEENKFISNGTKITGQDYYKALSIRCIKE